MRKLKTFLMIGFLTSALVSFGQIIDNPKASLRLEMKQSSGTNGCSIAFNPAKKLYYAVIAGNGDFPLEVFNTSGLNVYQTNSGIDMRGIWWNPKTKSLEGNGYGDGGIVSFALDASANPSQGNSTVFAGGRCQPDGQSVGTYNAKKKMMVYYNEGKVHMYKRKTGESTGALTLELSNTNIINGRTMIYTGKKKMEYGVLDFRNKKVLLFNAKTGKLTKTINLPPDAITHSSFRFAFANGFVFLYDTEERAWSGYKIFN